MNRDGDGRFSKDKHNNVVVEPIGHRGQRSNQIETKTKHGA